MANKAVYPIVLKQLEDGYFVHIPDFNVDTQGDSFDNAIEMARDAISLLITDLRCDGKYIPQPFSQSFRRSYQDIVTQVEIDLD